ncbi:MAG: hypothetical protein Q8O03_04145 [Nanoarchaeota archaeon]|nr:hypothetical protein [Nanoarchaeota archaeon]
MDKSLESKVEERKKQAEKKKICGKAWMVATYLGDRSYYRSDDGSLEQTTHTFKNDNFLITDEYSESHGHDGSMGGRSVDIEYKGKKVFEDVSGGVLSYIPGDWEKKLSKLYGKAEKARLQKEKEETEKRKDLAKKEEDKAKAKWGL